MNGIAWLLVFAASLALAGLVVWRQEKRKARTLEEPRAKVRRKTKPVQQLLPIDHVRADGTLVLADGGMRKVLRVGNLNPYALSAAEAEGIRARFQTLLSTLREPFQIIVRGRRMDLSEYYTYFDALVEATAQKWENDRLLQYGRDLHRHLEERGEQQRTLRENLWVTSAHANWLSKSDEEVHQAVQHETETAFAGLMQCRVHPTLLGAEEAIEAQQQFLNRDKVHARARDAVRYDSLRGYYIGKEADALDTPTSF
ncbi:hypothetical protein [Alicyclobacillus sp. SP_1]|jgi:type IV secretory pathway VirB4 component|uniref:hypothetical protein n=1 Tax=Alicyclobacillus sp. SP_1 TaxID=2942475 RepID=UPI00215832C6|nr:hypothetical protein [Alicyclobacillus sp. SP_1]